MQGVQTQWNSLWVNFQEVQTQYGENNRLKMASLTLKGPISGKSIHLIEGLRPHKSTGDNGQIV